MNVTIKSIVLSVFIWLPINSNAGELPFIGTRVFNFHGGTGTGYTIKIDENGYTVVHAHGVDDSFLLYEGKYQAHINHPDYGLSYYIIDESSIAYLDDGELLYGCKEEYLPCISAFYEL